MSCDQIPDRGTSDSRMQYPSEFAPHLDYPRGIQLRHCQFSIHANLLATLVDADIENVATSQNEIPKIGSWRIPSVLCGAVQYDVHMTVAVDHLAAVFDVILQPDADVRIEFLHEQIQRFP